LACSTCGALGGCWRLLLQQEAAAAEQHEGHVTPHHKVRTPAHQHLRQVLAEPRDKGGLCQTAVSHPSCKADQALGQKLLLLLLWLLLLLLWLLLLLLWLLLLLLLLLLLWLLLLWLLLLLLLLLWLLHCRQHDTDVSHAGHH
jgi:Flp pilus assembly protein TadB